MEKFKIAVVRKDPKGAILMDTYHVSPAEDPKNPGQFLTYEFDEKYNEVLSRIRTFVLQGVYQSLFRLDGIGLYISIHNVAHAIAELHFDNPWRTDPEDIDIQCRKELEKFIDWLHNVGASFTGLERDDLVLMVERGNITHYRV